jgi:hypothetical protein
MFTPSAEGTNPGEAGINQFLFQPQGGHANGLSRIKAIHSRDGTTAGTSPAGEAQVRHFGIHGQLAVLFVYFQRFFHIFTPSLLMTSQ